MPWTPDPHGGFSQGPPWLRLPPDQATRNVAVQSGQADSLLRWYADAIALRKRHPALQTGTMLLPPRDHPHILTWTRQAGEERIRILLNMTPQKRTWPSDPNERWTQVLLTTETRSSAEPAQTWLHPYEGRVVRLA